MDAMLELLSAAPARGVDLLVHIGAGAAPATLQLDGVRRLVLVEGDAGTRLQLALATAGRAGVEVWPDVVTPAAALTPWRRYSLPALNGPLDQAARVAQYPRLQVLADGVSPGTPVARLLEKALGGGTAGQRVLVLDVPGQEAALLEALPPALLQAFDRVVVRGTSQAPGAGCTLADTQRLLEAVDYRQGILADDDPLWPLASFALDQAAARLRAADTLRQAFGRELDGERAARHELLQQVQALQAERAELDARFAEQARQLVAMTAERDEQQRWHADNANWAKALKAQLAAAQAEAAAREAQQQERLAAVQAQRDALDAECAQARQARADAEAARDTALQDAAQERQWHHDNAQWARSLKSQLEALEARASTEAADHATAQQAQQQQRAELAAALAQAQAAAAEAEARRMEAAARHDEATAAAERAWHAERTELQASLAQAHAALAAATAEADAGARNAEARLAAGLEQHRAELDQALAQVAHFQRERQEADAAAALAAAAGQRQVEELGAQMAAVSAERDQERHWHHENARWAQALKAETEQLKTQLAGLQQQLAERDDRSRQIDTEILRAEAQLDLIKDVLLREKNF